MLGLSQLAAFALALKPAERIPNPDALAMSPTIGWLMMATLIFAIAMFVVQHDRWRRFFLTMEDPRPIGLLRIGFAFLVICNVNDVLEYFRMLFTDEGIFFTDVARQVFSSGQFQGFGDGLKEGEPYGFFGPDGVLTYMLGHKHSLLFFNDTPGAWNIHLWVFYIITTLFMIGWRTRLMGVLTYILFNSIILRNPLFWEGTELVYRVFFFYLIVSRCGHAYSVDNWLRCRRLRKKGLLSTPGGPGGGAGAPPSAEHPRGLAAIYRLIPAWPRWLALINLAALYSYTGVVKNGSVWAKGDALYYALNMDHFYRFYPQELSSIVGTNLFRLATWITHWWEACFPLMIVGLVFRWREWEHEKPLDKGRLWFVRLCWIGFGLGAGATAVVALPVHLPRHYNMPKSQLGFALGWLAMMLVLGVLWRLLAGPWTIKLGGRTITLRFPAFLNRRWFCTWVLGRRVWLTLGILFHGNLHLLMNIGMFAPIMLCTYCNGLMGDEPGRILRFIGHKLRFLPFIPEDVRRGDPPLPAEDPTLPHHIRDDRTLPVQFHWAMLGLAIVGVFLEYFEVQKFGWTAYFGGLVILGYSYYQGHRGTRGFGTRMAVLVLLMLAYTWLLHQEGDAMGWVKVWVHLGVALLLLLGRIPAIGRAAAKAGFSLTAPGHKPDGELSIYMPDTDYPRRPWAYGPTGRMLIGTMIVFHTIGVGIWLMPDKDVLNSWDIQAKHVFRRWLLHTGTDQAWGMFAPNPPRHNVFLRTVVTDENDEKWDLRTDLYAPERKPIPWWGNDRMRKMNRRIIGGESGKGDWYQKWYARWICREWELAHRGRAPKKVELFRVSYLMPSPEQVRTRGWYDPMVLMNMRGRESRKYAESCRSGINAQVPNHIRERYGLEPVDEKQVKLWHKKRWDKWQKRNDPQKHPMIKNIEAIERKVRAERRQKRREERQARGGK